MNYEPQEIEKADWMLIRLLSAMKQYIPSDVCFNNKDFRNTWGYLGGKYDCLQLSNAFASIKEEK